MVEESPDRRRCTRQWLPVHVVHVGRDESPRLRPLQREERFDRRVGDGVANHGVRDVVRRHLGLEC